MLHSTYSSKKAESIDIIQLIQKLDAVKMRDALDKSIIIGNFLKNRNDAIERQREKTHGIPYKPCRLFTKSNICMKKARQFYVLVRKDTWKPLKTKYEDIPGNVRENSSEHVLIQNISVLRCFTVITVFSIYGITGNIQWKTLK